MNVNPGRTYGVVLRGLDPCLESQHPVDILVLGPGFNDHIIFLNYVVGFASQETAFGKGPGGRERLDQVESFLGALPKDQFPDLTAVVGELTAGRFTARFELGLGAILDRLENENAQIGSTNQQPH